MLLGHHTEGGLHQNYSKTCSSKKVLSVLGSPLMDIDFKKKFKFFMDFMN